MSKFNYPDNEGLQVVTDRSSKRFNSDPIPVAVMAPIPPPYIAAQENSLEHANADAEKEVYNGNTPISTGEFGLLDKPLPPPKSTILRFKKKNFFILLGVAIVAIIAVAVGAGIGASKGQKSVMTEANSSPPASQNSGTALATPSSSTSTATTASLSTVTRPSTSTFSSAPAPTPTATSPSSCPSILTECSTAGCLGINGVDSARGRCTAGVNMGCPCASICGALDGLCSSGDCAGISGSCTGGAYRGCNCIGDCGINDGPCSLGDCAARDGVCTGGTYRGCKCVN